MSANSSESGSMCQLQPVFTLGSPRTTSPFGIEGASLPARSSFAIAMFWGSVRRTRYASPATSKVTIIEPAGNDCAGLDGRDGVLDGRSVGRIVGGRRVGLARGAVSGAVVGAALGTPGVGGLTVRGADVPGALAVHALKTNAVTSMVAARDRDKTSPRAAFCD